MNIYNESQIDLPKTDICLVTVPFSRKLEHPEVYFSALSNLLCIPNKYEKIIFTSSTSIYEATNALANEDAKLSQSKRAIALKKTEDHLIKQANTAYILRLSGICGFNRNSKSKRTLETVPDANQPVNLIHASDIIKVIKTLIERNIIEKDIINVTCSEHPTKEAYYTYLCNKFNTPHPQFLNSPNLKYKKVCNKKLQSKYSVSLTFPTPLSFEFSDE